MVTLRSMTFDDIVQLIEIDHITFPQETSQWSASPFIQFRFLLPDTFFVAVDGERIVGFIVGGIIQNDLTLAHEIKIAVHPDYQGQHLSTRLAQALEEVLIERGVKRLQLNVRPGNLKARSIYKKWGFVEREFIKDFYGRGEDSLIMQRDLPITAESATRNTRS